ncbi:MAG: hypothetical protein K6F53_13090 [Lachnospiraceae bacterium]|nr:hypothetical protein [Lachnospiraceae bacterium]
MKSRIFKGIVVLAAMVTVLSMAVFSYAAETKEKSAEEKQVEDLTLYLSALKAQGASAEQIAFATQCLEAAKAEFAKNATATPAANAQAAAAQAAAAAKAAAPAAATAVQSAAPGAAAIAQAATPADKIAAAKTAAAAMSNGHSAQYNTVILLLNSCNTIWDYWAIERTGIYGYGGWADLSNAVKNDKERNELSDTTKGIINVTRTKFEDAAKLPNGVVPSVPGCTYNPAFAGTMLQGNVYAYTLPDGRNVYVGFR